MSNMTFAAGTTVRLTSDITVTIGEVVTITSHPSGPAFDGPGVVVSASVNAQGFAVVRAVSLSDPTERIVIHSCEKIA